MMQKGYENRYQVEMISIEDLVPHDHLLRQISEAVDFSKIYEFVEELYCDDNWINVNKVDRKSEKIIHS